MSRHAKFRFLTAFVMGFVLTAAYVPQQATAAAATPIGVAPPGENALEFIGQIDQAGTSFISYGYLTYIYNLPDALLFSDPTTHSEATAQITYFATSTANAGGHAALANIIVHDSTGTVTFYLNKASGGSSFNDPKSFTGGVPILTASVRSQDILNVQGVNLGIATGISEFNQKTAESFTMQGQEYQLGNVGLLERFTFVGEGTRSATGPQGTIVVAGYAEVTGQAS
jgi:hypothetical protein